MTDRDPLDHLTAAERPELPDPQFSTRLLDRLLADLDVAASGASTQKIVQLQEDPNMNTTQSTWKWTLLGVAASIVVVVIGLVVLVSSDDDGEILDPSSTTAEVETVTTTAPATSEVTTVAPTTAAPTTDGAIDPVDAAWDEIPILLFSGVTGEFRTNTFGVPFKFETGQDAYSKDWEREDWFAVSNDDVPGWIDVFVGLESVDATVDAFRELHDQFDSAAMDEPEPTTLGGAEGVVFRSVGMPAGVAVTEQDRYEFTAPVPERGLWADSTAYGIALPGSSSSDGAGVSVWVVEVDGQVVVVAQSALDMQVTADEREAGRRGTRGLIDSIVWKDLPS